MKKQTVTINKSQFGDLQLPIPETSNIKIFDYVLVTVKPNQSIIVEKYQINTPIPKNSSIQFVNYNQSYLKQQSLRKSIKSKHQNN